MALVSVNNLTKNYEMGKMSVPALKGINLHIQCGDFLTIAGPSGSGKSTLLQLLGCLDSPSSGEIMLDNANISKMNEKQLNQIRLHNIGFIFQNFNLVSVLNIFENVELPLLIRKDITAKQRKEKVMHIIERVGLTSHIKHKSNELSGGQQQRVSIARALVKQPKIILADEPTANLDSQTANEIISLMQQMNQETKTTFVFSTHDNKIIERSPRVLFIEDGLIKHEEAA